MTKDKNTSQDEPSLDFSLDINDQDAIKAEIVSRIRPEWQLEDVAYKTFNDGITNKLMGVYERANKEDMIVIRVYGQGSDLFINRQAEIDNMKLLNKHNLGSKLYLRFTNGIAYEFIPGQTLTTKTVSNPEVYPNVARRIRQVHSIPLPTASQDSDDGMWDLLRKFHKLCPEGFQEDLSKDGKLKALPLNKEQIGEEIQEMKRVLASCSGAQLVFAHNDLLLGNIIVNNLGETKLIDYEYAGVNYREYDIANHFCEFVGTGEDGGRLDYENLYPTKEFQLQWIQEYLGDEADMEEVERVQQVVEKFSPLPNLLWGVWSLVQSKYSLIDFDFLDYAHQRFDFYKKRKHLAHKN